jgi:hypothetical protein
MTQDNLLGTVITCGLGELGSILGRSRDLSFRHHAQSGYGAHSALCSCVERRHNVELTTHIHPAVIQLLRIYGWLPPLPHMPLQLSA